MAAPAGLRVAVVGCAHGELDALYAAVGEAAAAAPGAAAGVDLVVCAGDFQAVRNEDDLECMAVPDKFKDMRQFWRYYAGGGDGCVAPVPTVFVGGNHEASNHLQELPLGGLVAPNVYYLGPAGVVNFRGLRIAGVSGVYAAHNYHRPAREAPPYPGSSLKSVYHTRAAAVDALARLARPVDVFLSHDWPAGVAEHGDKAALLRAKPFLRAELSDGRFGSPGSARLLALLRPRYWFAAHVHVKFAALVPHPSAPAGTPPTRFLALDKALPRRDFVQILDIRPAAGAPPFAGPPAPNAPTRFTLDPEWLAVLRSPTAGTAPVSDADCAAAEAAVTAGGLRMAVRSPDDFERTARAYNPAAKRRGARPSGVAVQARNVALAKALGVQLPGCGGGGGDTVPVAPVPLGVSLHARERQPAAGADEDSAAGEAGQEDAPAAGGGAGSKRPRLE
jgi:lariat debranching enzyme